MAPSRPVRRVLLWAAAGMGSRRASLRFRATGYLPLWESLFVASALPVLLLALALEPILAHPVTSAGEGQESSSFPSSRVSVIINGLGGTPKYEEDFLGWTDRLEEIFSSRSGLQVHRIRGERQGRLEILQLFARIASSGSAPDQLWLFLVGHASHDGLHYRFHIRGPDLTDGDLREWLETNPAKRVFVVAATSASGLLADRLKGQNRVIVTATRNERERQPPVFFSFFLEALETEETDTDKDGRLSLLETFFWARQKVAGWYAKNQRLQTEHPLLDDEGTTRLQGKDQAESSVLLASTAYLFEPAAETVSSPRARQQAKKKMALELQIQNLKRNKENLSEADYFHKLEELLLELARLSQELDRVGETP